MKETKDEAATETRTLKIIALAVFPLAAPFCVSLESAGVEVCLMY